MGFVKSISTYTGLIISAILNPQIPHLYVKILNELICEKNNSLMYAHFVCAYVRVHVHVCVCVCVKLNMKFTGT